LGSSGGHGSNLDGGHGSDLDQALLAAESALVKSDMEVRNSSATESDGCATASESGGGNTHHFSYTPEEMIAVRQLVQGMLVPPVDPKSLPKAVCPTVEGNGNYSAGKKYQKSNGGGGVGGGGKKSKGKKKKGATNSSTKQGGNGGGGGGSGGGGGRNGSSDGTGGADANRAVQLRLEGAAARQWISALDNEFLERAPPVVCAAIGADVAEALAVVELEAQFVAATGL
jgi:hypothetical protein